MKDTVAAAVKTGTKVSSRVGEGNERVCDGYSRTARGRFFSRGARGMKDLRHRATRHDRVSSRVGEGNESGRALESGTKSMRFPLAWDEGNESNKPLYNNWHCEYVSPRVGEGNERLPSGSGSSNEMVFPLAWGEGNDWYCEYRSFCASERNENYQLLNVSLILIKDFASR